MTSERNARIVFPELGTHALIQEKVVYKSLSLVITDEQHRFGVRQRETLAEEGSVAFGTLIPTSITVVDTSTSI